MAGEGSTKTKALLRWMSTFGTEFANTAQISDGVGMAMALRRIDPNHFSDSWFSKIKTSVPSDNKHLKATNLRKILVAIVDFNDIVPFVSLPDFGQPNVNSAAEGQPDEIGRMLQLILGCAVNCDHKQQYIESIMNLEESVQQVLMLAIQEMITSGSTKGEGDHIMSVLEDSNREREELRQKCHELEIQVKLLTENKSIMTTELDNLQVQVKGKIEAESYSGADFQIKDLRRQLEKAQDDVYKIEKEKDELSVKVEEADKALEEAATRETELQTLADQARQLKDEVDILRETADKVEKYEASIESYKKKMEEQADLRKQLKLLETKNTSLMQSNIDLEEGIKKAGNWRPQLEKYKKQVTDLQEKIDVGTKRADKSEFESKRILEKLEAISVERDRLQSERDDLKEKFNEVNDQLKIALDSSGGRGNQLHRLEGVSEHEASMMELIPPAIKERILRLQAENKRLKQGQKQEDPLLQTTIDDLKEREARLEATNRTLHQKTLELESKLEDSKGTGTPRLAGSREELELKLSDATKKITQLSETIHKKDVEMQGMEERYKKYIEKAKSVIKTLDPKQNPNAAPETMALRSQLSEKDRLLETLEQETEKARAVREMEERLISSAFYNLSMQMHRSTVEARLSNIHSTSSPHGQSFLARQRQVQNAQMGAAPTGGRANASSTSFTHTS